MFIRSQEKRHLVEVHDLSITRGRNEKFLIIEQKDLDEKFDYWIQLGEYDTEETAIYVLDCIQGHMGSLSVYVMPSQEQLDILRRKHELPGKPLV